MRITIPQSRRPAGILLIECLVYIAVFAILTSVGFAAFYLCWDQSKAVVYATEDIGAALRAGERWRADIRAATGTISMKQHADGQTVQIPEKGKVVIYRFETGEVRRETSASQNSELILSKVQSSRIGSVSGNGVAGYRWELQLAERRPETQLPLLFTFEAAENKP